MESGQVLQGPASLKLQPFPGMEDCAILQIVGFHTFEGEQGKGHGTALMREICRRADMSMFILVLSPEPFGKRTMDAKQLESWYGKFGFEVIQKRPVLMCREPKQHGREVLQ